MTNDARLLDATRQGGRVAMWVKGGLLVTLAALGGCGGGSGGGNEPSVPVEFPVVLGQAGSGDPDNYVPMAVGNTWHFTGTASGDFGAVVDNRASIVGTQVVNGVSTLVWRESNPGGGGSAAQEAVVKDANGLAVLAGDMLNQPLTRSLIPYWELRFPLIAGRSYVQLDRTRVDMGQDLDGDGRNETVSLKSDLRVAGTEAITVPAGSFGSAMRVDRAMMMSITLSRDGQVITAMQIGSVWLVRDVGWVRRTTTLTIQGKTSTMDEQLDAYNVGG